MKRRPDTAEAAALRQRAEARLRGQEAATAPSEADPRRLLHELQVHQVELELQNHVLLELRKQLEQRLEQYIDLYDFAPVGYFTLTGDGTIRRANLTGAVLLGVKRADVLDRRFGIFMAAADRPAFNAFLSRVLAGAVREHCEIALTGEGGPPRCLHLEGVAARSDADWVCQVVAVDISERKQAEAAVRASESSLLKTTEELRHSLKEKEILLREVHHRVKNNLAVIIDLLELQREGRVEETASQLKELGNRIRSMFLIHEMLYQSQNLHRIDFQAYLQMLTTHLRHAFDPQGAIHLKVAATDVYLDLDTAIPCGLIVNELVINALKYAFPGHRPWLGTSARKIAVTAEWDGATYTLRVADNGVGLPADLDWTTTRTLGLRLVRMLGQHQLGGQLELNGAPGTCFSLRFDSRQPKEANPDDRQKDPDR